jgi:hypothetical protein
MHVVTTAAAHDARYTPADHMEHDAHVAQQGNTAYMLQQWQLATVAIAAPMQQPAAEHKIAPMKQQGATIIAANNTGWCSAVDL